MAQEPELEGEREKEGGRILPLPQQQELRADVNASQSISVCRPLK